MHDAFDELLANSDVALAAVALKRATEALRDAGLSLRTAQNNYQAALDNWNRVVAPDPSVK